MIPDDPYLGIRAVVLGSSGFIGRWVARELCKRGAHVHLVVRDRHAVKKTFVEYDIKGEVFEMDLVKPDCLPTLLHEVRPSITFNLAGYGVDPSERDEETAYKTNSNLLETLCSAVAEARDPQWPGQDLVHVGSALEYGTIHGNLAEDSTPSPTTSYGKSKLAGTSLLARNCRTQQLSGLTARLFTVFGPGEHSGRLLPSLIEAARIGNPVPLTAGAQERDFTYVADVADGLLRLGLTTTPQPGEVVNLATGRLTSVRSFAETAARILGITQDRLRFGAKPMRSQEMQHAAVTVERLRRLTSWKPTTSVEAGIRQTLDFSKGHAPV
jgi:nucleoside-diphosphate-sugar epimerase